MNTARWIRRAAFVGSACLIAAAAWPGGSARATAPPQVFSSTATAEGISYDFDRNPAISQVSGATMGGAPHAKSVLGAGNGGTGQAASVFLGGLEGIPGLICTAAASDSGSPCDQIPAPKPGDFPPPFPFEADAQYPSHQTSDATVHGTTIGGHGAPLAVTAQTVHAEAHLLDASGKAVNNGSNFGNGVISSGSSTTVTTQAIDSSGAVVTTADSLVHDVDVVKLIHIGAVHSTVKVVYDGIHKPKVSASTKVSDVSVLGLPATIDHNGVHIVNQSNATVLNTLNKQLDFLLQSNYSTLTLLGVTNTPGDHKVAVQAGGLLFTFDDNVQGVPRTPPVTDIPGCNQIMQKLNKKLPGPVVTGLSQIPANLCTPPAPPDPNAEYIGAATIGGAGVLVTAQNFSYNFGGNGPVGLPGTGGSGPASQFVAGTPGTPGTSGTPGLGTSQPAPQIAGPAGSGGNATSAAYIEDLSGVAKKLKYLFPALLLAVIGILAGRVGRAPARLPRVSA